jgi:error-prone DNA polymerase
MSSRTEIRAGLDVGVYGKIQREGEVVHLMAHRLTDLSSDPASVGGRDSTFQAPHGRGDEFHHGAPRPDPRGMPKVRDIVDPYEHLDQIRDEDAEFQIDNETGFRSSTSVGFV